MKPILIVFAFLFGTGSCFEYDELIQQTINEIDVTMEMYSNTTLMNFYGYSVQSVAMQFQSYAEEVSQSENPYAIAHVINYRHNYTEIQVLLESMINDTRDEIVEVFSFQRQSIASLVPMIKATADDVYDMLNFRDCNETVMEEFYKNLVANTGMRVRQTLSEGYMAYISQLMNQFVPFSLYYNMIEQQRNCLHPVSGDLVETLDCMSRNEDLYMGVTMNLISESTQAVASLINFFNLKITYLVMKDVDQTFSDSYRNAFIINC